MHLRFQSGTRHARCYQLRREIHKKCARWSDFQSIIIVVDILTAFDQITHTTIANTMKLANVTPQAGLTLVKRYTDKTVQISINKSTISDKFNFTRSGWHGGTSTPTVFNLVFETHLEPIVQAWEKDRWDSELKAYSSTTRYLPTISC